MLLEQGIAVETLAGGPPTIAAELLDLAYRCDRPVVWLVGDDGDPAVIASLAPALATHAGAGGAPPTIEVVPGSYDLPGSRLLDLVAVMDRLRSPGGCPWDAEQTHQSLAPYLLEEAHETLEAIETGQRAALIEELGDLLLQVVFHARLGEEDADRSWSIDDVAAGIVTKLVNRHPHVFGDVDAPDAQYVADNWERIKAAEKGRTSVLDGIPAGLPALARAAKVVSRADRAELARRPGRRRAARRHDRGGGRRAPARHRRGCATARDRSGDRVARVRAWRLRPGARPGGLTRVS